MAEGVHRAMQPRPRLTDRDSTDQIFAATADRADPTRADRDAPPAPGDVPPAPGDVPAYRWSDLRPEIGARGAIVTMFMSSLIGNMAAQYLHAVRLTGLGFTVGCAAAASLTRRQAMLVVITTPPLIFLVAITCAEALAAHADHAGLPPGRICARALLTLASAAPWVFGGLAGVLVIATCRVLAQRIADFRTHRGARPATHRGKSL